MPAQRLLRAMSHPIDHALHPHSCIEVHVLPGARMESCGLRHFNLSLQQVKQVLTL